MLTFSEYFQDVEFDERSHSYKIRDKILTPATTLISSLETPFDSHKHATNTAKKLGTTKAAILKMWKENSEKGLANGKLVHQYCECNLTNIYFVPAHFSHLPEAKGFDKFWAAQQDNLTPVKVEWKIGSYDLGVGGTIDCLFYSQKTHLYHPMDWKTGKMSFRNTFQSLKPPFDGYEDTSYNRYSLQLSLYRLILREAGISQVGEAYIIHLTPEGDYQHYRAIDFTDALKLWLQSK